MILNPNSRWQDFAPNLAANALLSLAGNRNYKIETCLSIEKRRGGDNERRRGGEEEGRKGELVGWVLAPSTGRLPREGGSLEGPAPSRGRTTNLKAS